MKYRSRKNPMTAEERRQYDHEVEAYQARKELERHLNWERFQHREEEEAGGRRKAERQRRNPAPALGSIALAVLPHITKALGDKVSAFNALPVSERKARLRTFLQSKRRWGMGVAGGLAAPQIAKSDMALSAIVHAVERHGSKAVAEGSAAAVRHLEKKNPYKRRRNAGAYGLGTLHWRKIQEEAERRDLPPETLLPGGRGRSAFRPSDLAYAAMRMSSGDATRKDLLVLSKWSGQNLTGPHIDQEFWGGELLERFRREYPEEAERLNLN